eukprot:9080397-Pyramimonas_sp.AAC.1
MTIAEDVAVAEVEQVAAVLKLLLAGQLDDVEPVLLQVPGELHLPPHDIVRSEGGAVVSGVVGALVLCHQASVVLVLPNHVL